MDDTEILILIPTSWIRISLSSRRAASSSHSHPSASAPELAKHEQVFVNQSRPKNWKLTFNPKVSMTSPQIARLDEHFNNAGATLHFTIPEATQATPMFIWCPYKL